MQLEVGRGRGREGGDVPGLNNHLDLPFSHLKIRGIFMFFWNVFREIKIENVPVLN